MFRHVGWGKLRARRGMVGAMLPRARELLKHLCQIGALAGGEAAVRTRTRRSKRLLKARAHSARLHLLPRIGPCVQACCADVAMLVSCMQACMLACTHACQCCSAYFGLQSTHAARSTLPVVLNLGGN